MSTISDSPGLLPAALQGSRLVTAQTVADAFNIPVATVYALAREGLLASIRIGRSVRFCPEQLHEFIRQGGRSFEHGWRKDPVL